MLHVAMVPELFDRTLWSCATDERREELARAVGERLGPHFRYSGLRTYAGTDRPVAVYTFDLTGGEFSLVPGGGFDMGLSPAEERTIRGAREESGAGSEDDFDGEFDLLLSEIGQMRPLHRVVVPPFLIAQRVLQVGQAQRWLDGFRDPLYGPVSAATAHLDAEQLAVILVGTGLRLPSEAELEYAARGGLDRCLLPTGDRIPDENTLEAMIADTDGATHNAFGLHGYGLYPELCADRWHEHYKGAPDDGSPWPGAGTRVVRGGAADCFPWQGAGEWNMLLCAFRMSEHAAEFGAALRLVKGIADLDDVPADMPAQPDREASPAQAKKATTKRAAKKTAGKATGKKTAPARKVTARRATSAKKAAGKKVSKKR